ncbi:MAG: hypothetical protein ACJ05G_01815 [Actinomycetota bacterium]|nr:hypothetical protein [Acidimicrobiales bacterium]
MTNAPALLVNRRPEIPATVVDWCIGSHDTALKAQSPNMSLDSS